METEHPTINIALGLVAGALTWLQTHAHEYAWLISIGVSVLIGVGGKAADLIYREYVRRQEKK